MRRLFDKFLKRSKQTKPLMPEGWLNADVKRIDDTMAAHNVDLRKLFGSYGRTLQFPSDLSDRRYHKNAQVATELHGPVWWGDIYHDRSADALQELADKLGTTIHIIPEGVNPQSLDELRRISRHQVRPGKQAG